MIPFNKPYLHGRELEYIAESVASGKISGDGLFTKKCHSFFEERYQFTKTLMTTSCTDALEMSAILLNIKEGDEVILPSFTFVSTANAFALRGAKLIFADSDLDNPNISLEQIKALITKNTRAIVIVHYAGIACDMDGILELAKRNNIKVVEDAAQAIESTYKGRPLGSFGDLATFSFHETKNIISGEGGLLVVNNSDLASRAEVIREKGTNRGSFFRGEVDKYGWIDIGSSFLPSDIISAYLFAQLECIEEIQAKRKKIWRQYWDRLADILPKYEIKLPKIPTWASNNGHMFYLVCKNGLQRTNLIASLKDFHIQAVFHYQSLHKSPYFNKRHDNRQLPNSDRYSECLIRLPLYYELKETECDFICDKIISHLRK
jgi:dTDP-4-amino-4,6-dideoxygalactose transaminase